MRETRGVGSGCGYWNVALAKIAPWPVLEGAKTADEETFPVLLLVHTYTSYQVYFTLCNTATVLFPSLLILPLLVHTCSTIHSTKYVPGRSNGRGKST